jgi:DNA invertase Pin-like site-specific DNA recombinase
MSRAAYGYLRVSGVGQAGDDKDGLVRQKTAIKKWAVANDVHIRQWFSDSKSGTKDLENRPALQALMAALHGNGVRLVIVEKVDRLARDLMVQENIIADLQRNGFELVSTMEPDLCSSEPTRVLLRQMMGAFAQYERSMIVQKLWGARQRAKAKKPDTYKEGRKPFGHRKGEAEVIARVMELHASGLKLPAIASALNAEGRKTRYGGQWFPNQVSNIIKRAKV